MLYLGSLTEAIEYNGFIYAPFHRKTNYPVVVFEPEILFEGDADKSILTDLINSKKLYTFTESKTPYQAGKKEYLDQAGRFIAGFDPLFRKAVLSRVKIEKKPVDFDPASFYFRLIDSYPNTFCHLIHMPGNGTWTGSSPETLLRTDGKNAITVSLAGTRKVQERGFAAEWGDKEKEEQQIVTDYITEVLGKNGIEVFSKGEPEEQTAGNLAHLSTVFQFESGLLKGKTGNFLDELHPSPAVCGSPKDRALELILSTEKHNREYYSGFCGFKANPENLDLFVNLRCMKILPDKLALYAGGGLTASSCPEDEWMETEIKTKTLLSLLDQT